jgi:hypothetical protein
VIKTRCEEVAEFATLAAWLLMACSSDQSPAKSAHAECSETPRLLLDFVPLVPEEGRMAVEMPQVYATSDAVYFILNWNTPLSSTGSSTRAGYLLKMPLGGGVVTQLSTVPGGGSPGVESLVVLGQTIFFAAATADGGTSGEVRSVSVTGGAATVTAMSSSMISAVAADAGSIYFADDEGVKQISRATSAVTQLSNASATSLSIDGSALYLTNIGTGMVARFDLASNKLELLADNQSGPEFARACDADVCWTNAGDGSVLRLSDGASPQVLVTDVREPHALAVDGDNLFITSGAGGLRLTRVPISGGKSVDVASEAGMTGLTLSANCLYWSSLNGISAMSRAAAATFSGAD